MSEIQDRNTAYLYVGPVTYEVTENYISEVTNLASTELGLGKTQSFIINMPMNRDGVKQDFCYIWWDNSTVLQQILDEHEMGLCSFEDGVYSFCIQRCTVKIPENAQLNLSTLTTFNAIPDWLQEEQIKAIFSRFNVSGYFNCKILRKVEKQHSKKVIETELSSGEDKILKRESHTRSRGNEGTVNVPYGRRGAIESDLDLKRFSPGSFEETKPEQNSGGNRRLLIRYDRNSNDAIFALNMCRILELTHGEESVVFFFTHGRERNQTQKSHNK